MKRFENRIFGDLKKVGLEPLIENRLGSFLSIRGIRTEHKKVDFNTVNSILKTDVDNLQNDLENGIVSEIPLKEYF